MKYWYLGATKPRQEERAYEHLNNQSIHALLPSIEIEKSLKGRLSRVIEPMFPGYIFIQLDDAHEGWSKVRSTRGMRHFVQFNGYPARVNQQIIDSLIAFQIGAEVLPKISQLPEKGQSVYISDGAFQGLEGIFERIKGEDRAIILLDVLGKMQRLEMKLEQLLIN